MSCRAGTAAVLLGLVLAGCGGGGDGAAPVRTTPSPSATSASGDDTAGAHDTASADENDATTASAEENDATPAGPVVTTSASEYGTVLVDGRRQAIYLFDRETGRTPRCYGACAVAWPPVLTKGDARADRQVHSGLLGTVERRDGSVQVTYAGHPLYFYAHEGPGQLLCHDIVEYGGRWLAVAPRGVAAPA
jgi:predicted lipoprotein with Yx(FWY)xxD motif